jgi:hypothetical protein
MAEITPERLAELEALERAATPGPWEAGRMDMESYDGNGYGPYKNVYTDDPRGGVHPVTGEVLPYTVARGEGAECRPNAALIEALRNAAPDLITALRAAWARIAELERAIGASESCFEHADNCCTDWYNACRAGAAGVRARGEVKRG